MASGKARIQKIKQHYLPLLLTIEAYLSFKCCYTQILIYEVTSLSLLTYHGAGINAKTLEGYTILDKAVMHGRVDVAQWLASSQGASHSLSPLSTGTPTANISSNNDIGTSLKIKPHICPRPHGSEVWFA